ncbi:hypothetical protein [Streptococcus suis]|uniref:hypothetical protein n=1 Tax=Streptococcus suis TaxID=1307 RepID=UPI0016394E29|nr:hypothetical protein [Streptococcus suis]
MLDTPPNRYHCISKTPQRLLGAFLLPEFQKIAFFQNLIEKYLLLSRTFLKIAVFADKKRPCPEVLSIPSAFFNTFFNTFFIDCWQIE